jgi:hypothetical protein
MKLRLNAVHHSYLIYICVAAAIVLPIGALLQHGEQKEIEWTQPFRRACYWTINCSTMWAPRPSCQNPVLLHIFSRLTPHVHVAWGA